jgi:hypothetical protein
MLDYEFPDITAIVMVLALGFVGYGISVVLDIYALRFLGAAREAAFFATAPFIGALAAVPILGEGWGVAEYLAGATMAIGVSVLLREHHSHLHAHTGMEHDHIHAHADPHHQHDHEGEVVGSHAHWHRHLSLQHDHGHVSDVHHRHEH